MNGFSPDNAWLLIAFGTAFHTVKYIELSHRTLGIEPIQSFISLYIYIIYIYIYMYIIEEEGIQRQKCMGRHDDAGIFGGAHLDTDTNIA